MIRIITLFLCVVLTAAAAGRYSADASVREAKQELERLDLERIEEARAIQVLRAEIAYLENPERLAKIAGLATELRPTALEQTHNARDFAALMGAEEAMPEIEAPKPNRDFIGDALAMAQMAPSETTN